MVFAPVQPILAKIPATTLTATIAGKQLDPQTFDKPGEQRYERAVPARLDTLAYSRFWPKFQGDLQFRPDVHHDQLSLALHGDWRQT